MNVATCSTTLQFHEKTTAGACTIETTIVVVFGPLIPMCMGIDAVIIRCCLTDSELQQTIVMLSIMQQQRQRDLSSGTTHR